jgi:rhamnogalacturonan endolyase
MRYPLRFSAWFLGPTMALACSSGGTPGDDAFASGGASNTGGALNAGGGIGVGGGVSGGATAALGGSAAGGGSSVGGNGSGAATASGGALGMGGGAASGGSTDPSGGATSSGGDGSGTGGVGVELPTGFAQMEALDRGVVAVPASTGGNLVSWRLFGYEPKDLGFVVYRDGTKITNTPITTSTNYVDAQGTANSKYEVRPVIGGVEGEESPEATVWAGGYLEIPTAAPPGGNNVDGAYTYSSSDGSVGDLDGDGRYDLVIKWDPSNAKDNSQAGHTGNVFIDAYTLDKERLWRIDLGVNIRAGAHYTQFLVYDLDGDGRAEVAMKTAPGTKDASGQFLRTGPAASDDDAVDYRNSSGYILTGPEYLTVFDGATGAEITTIPFEVARGRVADWGDDYGNRVDRFLGAVAFFSDDGRPSLLIGRGMYTRTTFTAWDFDGQTLTRRFLSDNPSNGMYAGKGAHGISIANVDSDPQQEIIGGAATFDHDGKPMCTVSFYGHGDALHVSDLVPSRPGLEVFMPYEAASVPAYGMRDARTCQLIFQGANTPSDGEGPGRGVAGDVDPNSPGAEAWVSGGSLLRGDTGASIGTKPRFDNFLIWWDGDLSRELLDSNTVRQHDAAGGILTADGCASNNGTKSTPTLSGDLLGDFREEVVFRCGNSIRIYSTGEVTEHRIFTLMHDPQYRSAISWQNVEYNQPPHPSFHIGQGMQEPPVPDIHLP